ncbi:hypothetical protein [Thalassomonas actiniarum]|uniref:DUF2489 domain-containing protein n=1 Tax=Thalassomonas actiniarum TaxID=485447 RepID=A0AAE9YY67_9GAMM|nr:hypothetical protein [Thalassomonas actiniarum]WDE02600.1 hypothetical protein SG35_029800 [Thalassomonas actiniarum]
MKWETLIPVTITIIFVVIGWVVAHKLTSQRDIKNKQREIRIQYLLEAYEALMVAGRNRTILPNYEQVERAVFLLEMFGTPSQVELSRKFTKEMAENNNSNFTELVVEIRNFVRNELDLKHLGRDINILRIDPINPEHNKLIQPTAKASAD